MTTEKRGTVKVCGSDYSPIENALIFAQVLDANGDPGNSATVILNLFNSDGTKYLDTKTMTYIDSSNGLYKYAFTAPSGTQRMIADIAVTGPTAYGSESVCVSELASNTSSVKKIQSGRWKIVSNQMIIYDSDNETPLLTFDLKDSSGQPAESNIIERVPA